MIEVFLSFLDECQAQLLVDTAERWRKCLDAYPTIIQIPEQGFEIKRRVLADKLAKTDPYIIADILCVPAQPKFIQSISERFKKEGMVGLGMVGDTDKPKYPTGVRVCRKGIIEKWPTQITEEYDQEHAEAIRSAGKRVEMWPDIFYLCLSGQQTDA